MLQRQKRQKSTSFIVKIPFYGPGVSNWYGFATKGVGRDDRPIQGTVDRCLTLVRAMNPDTTGDDRVDPADPMDAAVDVQDNTEKYEN